ncbi:hypothetical protein [Prosthecobacter vanneervenii]|uniref:Uncharacterized protein n=1 Tax=Prosthecobacter vanneervenii TaxID=48466 RepID=A0A7W8DM40_9BACT|nr:hypothetical protein [Prosthecobacter vanneervenii]MBB5034983.1 hypothetical protein [Prosthecobacter vanneervenii]
MWQTLRRTNPLVVGRFGEGSEEQKCDLDAKHTPTYDPEPAPPAFETGRNTMMKRKTRMLTDIREFSRMTPGMLGFTFIRGHSSSFALGIFPSAS